MKRNLLKAIGISFLVFVVLSWIIPVGTYSNGKFTTNGIDAVGLFDLIGIPVSTMLTFALYAAVFACIGGLYGVMKKTGALDALVERKVQKSAGKEKRFIIFTIILFVVLSSLTGLVLPLFVLVPLFAMILFGLGYDKVSALAATVGAILIGSVASTFGFNITGYTKNVLSLDMTSEIIAKVILLVLLTAALIFFVLKFKPKTKELKKEKIKEQKVEKTTKKEEVKAPVKKVSNSTKKGTAKKATTKKTTKKKSGTKNMAIAKDVKKVKTPKSISTLPLIIILIIMMLVTTLGMYNWYYAFEISAFGDIHTAVTEVTIGDFLIFEHLLSGISQFGYWGNSEFIVIMVIASILIAFIYRLKVGEYVEAFIAGIKRMMPTALYATLASVILTVLYQASYNGTGTLVDTMFNATMGLTDGFNVITTGITALYGSFFYNDLYYLLSSISVYVSEFSAHSLNIAGLLIQSVYGIGMIIFPTSVILIAGLSYFDVSYKQWFKYIWKFALAAFLIVLIVCAILTLL